MMKTPMGEIHVSLEEDRKWYILKAYGGDKLKSIKDGCRAKIAGDSRQNITACMAAVNEAFLLGYQAGQDELKQRIDRHFTEGGGKA